VSKLNNKIILLAGPTASGKSKIAILLSKKIKGEIVNADSMQIYKEIKILSSRPSKKDMSKVKHHLYGFISVKKKFSVGHWYKEVKKKINSILKRGKIPILVGGTGLYFKSITAGLSTIPKISEKKRLQVRELYKKLGQEDFFKRLILLDPKSVRKIVSSDTQRVLRAYEVKKFTKKSLYDWAKNTKSDFVDYDLRKIYLNTPRDIQLNLIEKRTKTILGKQAVSEVKKFLKMRVNKTLSANNIIGIKEIKKFLEGRITKKELFEQVNIRTRQYAKRQSTWQRGNMTSWEMLYSNDFSVLFKKILKLSS
tara:strand:- start:921 stop:1847 length:927 start_codon:yes stop_codon:yes gene_type:complete